MNDLTSKIPVKAQLAGSAGVEVFTTELSHIPREGEFIYYASHEFEEAAMYRVTRVMHTILPFNIGNDHAVGLILQRVSK